jgi:hypothetical protein
MRHAVLLAASLMILGTPTLSLAGPREDVAGATQAWVRRLRMRPLVAHCHLGLGKLYWRTGKREQAQEHLAIATTMYREMDMRFWVEQGGGRDNTNLKRLNKCTCSHSEKDQAPCGDTGRRMRVRGV